MIEKQKTKNVQLLLNAAKYSENPRAFVIDNKETFVYFTGYYGILTQSPVADLVGLEDGNKIKKSIYSQLKNMKDNCVDELSTPISPKTLKEEIAYRKEEFRSNWDANGSARKYYFGDEDKPMVNIEYLYRLVTLFPESTICYNKSQGQLSPLWFSADGMKGFLLPIRQTQGTNPQNISKPITTDNDSDEEEPF